jgi:hypothetical protein
MVHHAWDNLFGDRMIGSCLRTFRSGPLVTGCPRDGGIMALYQSFREAHRPAGQGMKDRNRPNNFSINKPSKPQRSQSKAKLSSFSYMEAPKIKEPTEKMFGYEINTKQDYKPIAVENTNFGVFTASFIGSNDLSLNDFHNEKLFLFAKCTRRYIPPKDFKFQLPSQRKPEIAFIGRSNVGKSSLIDSLLGYQKIVTISKEAGCTKTINFYAFIKTANSEIATIPIDQHYAYLVDMPGYGFARISKTIMENWKKVLESYLLVRDLSILRCEHLPSLQSLPLTTT